MDFIDELRQFSSRVEQLKDQIKTEEATKTSLILPFFQLLGYDIFNPAEFVPEFIADMGIKKGEKVDYAILRDGKPIILIEAKWCGEKLDKHDSQLFRYFGTTPSKFGVLTNGIVYRFYTDLEEPNKMDELPFMELNLLDIKEGLIPELKKFQKSNLDVDTIFNTASELKYSNRIKHLLAEQLNAPTDNFITYVLSEVYPGRKTQPVIDKFRPIVKKSFNHFVNEFMNEKIKTALGSQIEEEIQANAPEEPPLVPKILTTVNELEAYFIVKGLLRDEVPPSRLAYKDTESYLAVLLDNNTRKWICRFVMSDNQKSIYIPDDNKNPVRYGLDNIEDIYNYKDKLIEVMRRYL